jgi:hypothetical protein
MVTRACLLCAVAASCYSPNLAECVVACAQPDDCGPGQTCGSDGLCASPEIAGRCDELDAPDARPGPDAYDDPDDPDARVDARPSIDAVVGATLRIVIDGRGKVKAGPPIDHDCDAPDENGATCMFPAPIASVVQLQANDGHGWEFVSWSGCAPTSGPTCVVTVGPGTTLVGALFVED